MSFFLMNHPLEYTRPSGIPDQHFGSGLDHEDLLAPLVARELRNLLHHPAGYVRPWRSSIAHNVTGSTISLDKDKFQANLDVQHFKPEEISVKVSGNVITVEGKHEEKPDEHGFIARNFIRKYVVPKGHDLEKIESTLSSDGILSIFAPKINMGKDGQRSIPVVQTGQPSKALEQKKEEEKKEEANGENE